MYWDGKKWVGISSDAVFATISFVVPEKMKGSDLAILFWDGTNWVELSENRYLDGGLFVNRGGHLSEDGQRFEVSVNFSGTFVLVQK